MASRKAAHPQSELAGDLKVRGLRRQDRRVGATARAAQLHDGVVPRVTRRKPAGRDTPSPSAAFQWDTWMQWRINTSQFNGTDMITLTGRRNDVAFTLQPARPARSGHRVRSGHRPCPGAGVGACRGVRRAERARPAKLDGAAEGLRAQGIEVAVAAFDVTDQARSLKPASSKSSARSGRSISWSTMPASSAAHRWRTMRRRPGTS